MGSLKSKLLSKIPGFRKFYQTIARLDAERIECVERAAALATRIVELEAENRKLRKENQELIGFQPADGLAPLMLVNYRLRSELNRAVAACAQERDKRIGLNNDQGIKS